jgi:hypothetical protein
MVSHAEKKTMERLLEQLDSDEVKQAIESGVQAAKDAHAIAELTASVERAKTATVEKDGALAASAAVVAQLEQAQQEAAARAEKDAEDVDDLRCVGVFYVQGFRQRCFVAL